jgi:DNA-binding transcriptional LysR family regulator
MPSNTICSQYLYLPSLNKYFAYWNAFIAQDYIERLSATGFQGRTVIPSGSMELRHLRYFIALSEELHFSRAAKRLHVSQPPLTRQIRQLEQELGVDLLYRTTRKVELTEAGRAFANEARQIITHVAHASGLASQANRGIAGELVLGYTPARAHIVAKAVKVFSKLYSSVQITLRDMSGQGLQPIRDGRIDLGFVAQPVDGTGLVVSTVLRESYVVALPEKHRLAAGHSVSIRELAKEPILLFPRYSNPVGYDILVALFRARELTMNVSLEVENLHMRMELLRAGFGLCVFRRSVSEILYGKDIVIRPLQNSPVAQVGIAYSPENRSHTLSLFIDCVKQKLRKDLNK